MSQKNNPSDEKSPPPENDEQNAEQKSEAKHGKNPLEWAVFGVSLMITLATVGFLGVQAWHFDESPPRLEARLGALVKKGDTIMVPVDVANEGGTTAEGVEVEVTHQKDTANFVLLAVPRFGQRRGWVNFDSPIQASALKVRVLGYEEP